MLDRASRSSERRISRSMSDKPPAGAFLSGGPRARVGGAEVGRGARRPGGEDRRGEAEQAAGGCVWVGGEGRRGGPPAPPLTLFDRGAGGDQEEPVPHRPPRRVERSAGPPGPQ